VYSSLAFKVLHLEISHSIRPFPGAIAKIEPSGGGTSIFSALLAASAQLSTNGKNKDKQIVLLTDGFKDTQDVRDVQPYSKILRFTFSDGCF